MALAAAQVIDALAARLATVPATAGRVYTDRARPLATLPAWRIVAGDESAQRAYLDGGHQYDLQLEATAVVEAVDGVDDAMHALASAGLAALFAPPLLHGLEHTGTRRQLAAEGEARLGVITLQLRAQYFADPAAPDVIVG